MLDSLSSHRTERVLDSLNSLPITLLFIPGGLTGHVQPVDVGINGPLKHWIKERWSVSLLETEMTPTQKRVKIARLIADSWERITSETVSHSFNNILSGCITHRNEDDEVDIL